jgi:hypothetical protein
VIPDNLDRLEQQEAAIRARSLSAISADAELAYHVQTIESCMDLIHYFVQHHQSNDPDELTIQLLGIRLFNTAASAFSLLTRGYYQNATSLIRDLLETGFLLDDFLTDRGRIKLWRESTDKERRDIFAPVKVRTRLDDRDGFTERKRAEAYELLCSFASHPTYKGFQMVAPEGLGVVGPFYDLKFLTAVVQELSKRIIDPTLKYGSHFPNTDQHASAHLRLLETVQAYARKYLGATDAEFTTI